MRHLARHLAALFVVLYALSAQARETWREAHSPHFDLVSNANEKSARAVLARMEQFRRALGRVLPNQKLVGEVATQIYAFRDFESFSSFLPRTRDGVTEAAGYFRRGPYKNIIAIDLSAGPGAYERVVFHEYVHFILSLTTRTHPLWFQEGMAEFYAGMRLRGDSIVVGGGVLRHRRVLFENAMLPLEELLTAGAQRPLSSSPSENAVFYAQSWALVHYLIVDRGEEGHRHLAHYLSALSRGEEVLEAFQAAFGVNAHGMCLMPLMKDDARRSGSPVIRRSGRRVNSSRNMIVISRRARLAPRQKCGPGPPKPTCSLGERRRSKRKGSSKTSSSRLPEL